jgi:hypothetical protein
MFGRHHANREFRPASSARQINPETSSHSQIPWTYISPSAVRPLLMGDIMRRTNKSSSLTTRSQGSGSAGFIRIPALARASKSAVLRFDRLAPRGTAEARFEASGFVDGARSGMLGLERMPLSYVKTKQLSRTYVRARMDAWPARCGRSILILPRPYRLSLRDSPWERTDFLF